MSEITHIDDQDFIDELKLLISKGRNPLHHADLEKYTDEKGAFFMPSLRTYIDNRLVIAGSKNGYSSRKTALGKFGELLDKANEQ